MVMAQIASFIKHDHYQSSDHGEVCLSDSSIAVITLTISHIFINTHTAINSNLSTSLQERLIRAKREVVAVGHRSSVAEH